MLVLMAEAEARTLVKMNLVILNTKSTPGFISSDSPCTWYDPIWSVTHPLLGSHKIMESATIEIFMPLSPQQLVCFTWEKDFEGYIDLESIEPVDFLNQKTRYYCKEFFLANTAEPKDIWFNEEFIVRKILPPVELDERFPYNVLNKKEEEDQEIKNVIEDWLHNGIDFRETGKKTRIRLDSGDIHKEIEKRTGRKFEIGEDDKIILKKNLPPIFYKEIAKNVIVLTGPIFEPTYGIHGLRINIEGDGKKEWIRKIEELLNKTSYTQEKYIEAALIELKQELEFKKPRGISQQALKGNPSASEIKKNAAILYYWLRSQIVDKSKRYRHIDSELERLKLRTGQWRNAETAKKLTFELVKRKYRKSNWNISFLSFFDTYIKRVMSEKEAERHLQDEEYPLWPMLANKFLHMDSILWLLCFHEDKMLVVKNPEIVQKDPLICKFEVWNEELTNFQEKKLAYRDTDLSWFDT